MKNIIISFLLLPFLSAYNANSQENFSHDLGKVTQYEMSMTEYDKDKDAEALVIYDFGENYFRGDDNRGFLLYMKRTMKIKILKQAGVEYANFEIPYYMEDRDWESIDNIVGYVHSKDLFKCEKIKIEDLLRKIDYVTEEMTAQNLLTFLTKNKKSVVVVKDEYGGTAGIVTLEDLIEEIFGDIGDELDKDEFIEKQVADDEYVFSARLEIKEINRKYDIDLPDNDNYETLSGMITYHLENIPKERDVITIGNFVFTILKTDKNRIDKVLLKIT